MKSPLYGFRFVVALSVLALGCTAARANDIYIAQAATGAGTGQSCATAYAVTFFNTSANWGTGASQIGPGTTVHLCGTFVGPTGATIPYLSFSGSGTSRKPITLFFEPNAVLTSPYWGTTVINIQNVSYVVVDGGTNGLIQATLTGSPAATCIAGPCSYSPSSYAGTGVGITSASNIEVRNLTVSDMYVHIGTGDDANGNSAGIAIGGGGSAISIDNNTIHDAMKGVWAQYDQVGETGYSIFNNTIYNVNWGVAGGDARANSSLTGLLVYSNTIYDLANWNTTSDSFHHNGVYFWAEQPGGAIRAPIAFYNNNVHGNFGGSNCTAGIYISTGGSQ